MTSLLSGSRLGADALQEFRVRIAQMQAMQDSLEYIGFEDNKLARMLANGQLPAFFWGSATVIADPPIKVSLPPEDSSRHAATGWSAYWSKRNRS